MKFRRVINKPIDVDEDGVHVKGGVNAVVAANVNEKGVSRTRVSSRQRIVQRNGRTEVFEQEVKTDDDDDDTEAT